MALDLNNPDRSSEEQLYLPVNGTTFPFGEKKYPIDSGFNLLQEPLRRRHLTVARGS